MELLPFSKTTTGRQVIEALLKAQTPEDVFEFIRDWDRKQADASGVPQEYNMFPTTVQVITNNLVRGLEAGWMPNSEGERIEDLFNAYWDKYPDVYNHIEATSFDNAPRALQQEVSGRMMDELLDNFLRKVPSDANEPVTLPAL